MLCFIMLFVWYHCYDVIGASKKIKEQQKKNTNHKVAYLIMNISKHSVEI